MEPYVALLESIAAGSQEALEKAWVTVNDVWMKRHNRFSESCNPEGILDLQALALGRVAQKLGLRVPDTNPFAPQALLELGGKSP